VNQRAPGYLAILALDEPTVGQHSRAQASGPGPRIFPASPSRPADTPICITRTIDMTCRPAIRCPLKWGKSAWVHLVDFTAVSIQQASRGEGDKLTLPLKLPIGPVHGPVSLINTLLHQRRLARNWAAGLERGPDFSQFAGFADEWRAASTVVERQIRYTRFRISRGCQ